MPVSPRRPVLFGLFLPGALITAAAGLWPQPSPAGIEPEDTVAARQSSRPAGDPLESRALARLDDLVESAMRDRQLPGAVLEVGHRGRTVYRKAFGRRAIEPAPEAMTLDTIFDVASLTKVVATTTSVMILVEEGRIQLADRVAAFIPDFGKYGKDDITVRHLLTHMSGLRPDLELDVAFEGREEAIRRAIEEVPLAPPDRRFIYSDINFFLLGDIVGRVSGLSLERFAAARIFEPLKMGDTMFLPLDRLRVRIAPTEACPPLGWPCGGPGSVMLRGVVHDPTARRMGGVAGHAGLFSTAADLARFCRMLLAGGALDGARVLSPLAVARMVAPSSPPGEPNVRGLGWDMDSRFSANRGDLFPFGSYGHTGFTGTSLWIDPRSETYVIFLSNRVHPNGKGDVTALRGKVATIVAGALAGAPMPEARAAPAAGLMIPPAGPAASRSRETVLTGIDVLRSEAFARLAGRKVGLVTNHTGRARDLSATIDLLHQAPGVTLVALFSPEHGIRGVLDDKVPSSIDERTKLPIHSLYGDTRRPTADALTGIDTLVVDIQDIGARFYTYISTLGLVLEEAATRGIRVVVLDRPNPVGGFAIEGPIQDADVKGFTAYFPMPVRHGLTMGELARLFNGENRIGAELDVIQMTGWRRDRWFDETGLPWINPSPNMRNMIQAALYPGIGAIEGTNLSVGRGTDTPFEQIGAPWIDGVRLASELNARQLPGISFYPVSFTPATSKYAGEACQGVFMIVTDRGLLQPVRVGLEIAAALHRLYGSQYELESALGLLGSREVITRIRAGDDPARIAAGWSDDETRWRLRRAPYLLYY
jgi:uncharacterized protein YbbC (DUF1343 family)/CubicO group peptidase (beta-lactamase class C family)